MTTSLKEILDRMAEARHRRKEIKASINDVLQQSDTYRKTIDDLNALKAKKAEHEHQVMGTFPMESQELEKISASLKADAQLLADVALTMYTKGETITIEDAENGIKYEPVFRLSFKKEQLQLPL